MYKVFDDLLKTELIDCGGYSNLGGNQYSSVIKVYSAPSGWEVDTIVPKSSGSTAISISTISYNINDNKITVGIINGYSNKVSTNHIEVLVILKRS